MDPALVPASVDCDDAKAKLVPDALKNHGKNQVLSDTIGCDGPSDVEPSSSGGHIAGSSSAVLNSDPPPEVAASAKQGSSSAEDDSNASDSSDDEDDNNNLVTVAHLYRMMTQGVNPRQVLQRVLGLSDSEIDQSMLEECTDRDLWRLLFETLSCRQKIRQHNTLQDAVELINKSQKIIVLTGAGISVSCGIPDFRSPNGLYRRLKEEFPHLRDPTNMFNINFFKNDPQPFFSFAKELYPGKFEPSVTHQFIKALEENGKLLRNYSQNIDTLEKISGINNVMLCHGSFATASCLKCSHQVSSDCIRDDVLEGRVPRCTQCVTGPLSVYKPDIVFFGEGLPDEFHISIERDKLVCDLLIVIGTSLKVHPVASIPGYVATVPQIVINREPVTDHNFDIELLGDADIITQQLSHLLGWTGHLNPSFRPLSEITQDMAETQYRRDRNPDPVTPEDFDIVALREMYESRNLGAWLPESKDKYMFVPPSRYIFPGAMVLEKDHSPKGLPFSRRDVAPDGNVKKPDVEIAKASSSKSD